MHITWAVQKEVPVGKKDVKPINSPAIHAIPRCMGLQKDEGLKPEKFSNMNWVGRTVTHASKLSSLPMKIIQAEQVP